MEPESYQLFEDLLLTCSPSGNEQTIQRLIHSRMRWCVPFLEPDIYGNLLLGTNTEAQFRVLLDGHCDQIGFLVRHISEDGFLFVDQVGGIDETVLLGARLIVHSLDGPIPGVIGKKAIHLQTSEQRNRVPEPETMWIDVGARSREELEQVIPLGCYATFEPRVTQLRNDRLLAPGLDNKAGLFVVLETLKRCASQSLNVALYVSSSAQEELGLRGAGVVGNRLNPHIGITVDVTHALDDPGITDKTVIPCDLGKGPTVSAGPNTNPVVAHRLREAAKRRKIPIQSMPQAKLAGNDSKKLQVAGSGVATANLGVPNRNMHTQAEVCSLADIEAAVELLVEFITTLEDDIDLTPFNFQQPALAV